MRSVVCVVLVFVLRLRSICDSQFVPNNSYLTSNTTSLPFPPCRADNIPCLRRGLRTFFFLMDSKYLGMQPIDPILINSVGVSYPDQQMSFLLRNVNVTGANWSRLSDRRFNLVNGKNGVTFKSDLHITADIIMETAENLDPYVAFITMDIADVESNVTYYWANLQDINKDDYIIIGAERIAIRNTRTPTFFLQKNIEDSNVIEEALTASPSVVDYLANEVVAGLMHFIVDNFRLFASQVPVKMYYTYI